MKTIIKSTRLLLSILVALTLTMILGANRAKANAQQVVFLVQYAEVAVGEDALTEGGQRRAKALARLLKDADIDVIYSFDRPYVVLTAEPTAKALNIKTNILRFEYEVVDDLIRRLPTQHAKHRVLIVTGPSAREHILRSLGLTEVWKARIDNLYVIVPGSGSEPLVIKMRW